MNSDMLHWTMRRSGGEDRPAMGTEELAGGYSTCQKRSTNRLNRMVHDDQVVSKEKFGSPQESHFPPFLSTS
jgi:hypothetical protein